MSIVERMFVEVAGGETRQVDAGREAASDGPVLGDALDGLAGEIDGVLGSISPVGLTADGAAAAIAGLERQVRRLQATQVKLFAAVETSRAYCADGHFSARVMVRHHGQLSGPEASQRQRVSAMLAILRGVASLYAAGGVGTDQVRRLARVWSNPRVRGFMELCEAELIMAATKMEFLDFDRFCQQWEQAVDVDGGHDPAERRWRRRDVKASQDFNGTWGLNGRLMSLDGAEFDEILSGLVSTLREADMEAAKAEYGDDWRQHMPRTTPQLRYDAFMILVRRGAVAPDSRSAEVIVNVVIDQDTFERQLGELVGAEPAPVIPREIAEALIAGTRFSRTINGVFVNPAEVAARALTDRIRRVVVESPSVVIDVGRTQRLFTGSPRLAAIMQATRCYWHGCTRPATQCQVDHLTPFRNGGQTSTANGRSACNGHNLTKEHGYQVSRGPDGTITIIRPDGATVPTHTTHWQQPRDG